MDINNNCLPENTLQTSMLNLINSLNEDNTINKLIDIFNNLENVLLKTIERKQAELQKELGIDEVLTNSYISDVNLNHHEQYKLQSYATDIIDFTNTKINKLKQLISTENKEVVHQLNKFMDKKRQMNTSLSFAVNASELIFDSPTKMNKHNSNFTVDFLSPINKSVYQAPMSSLDVHPRTVISSDVPHARESISTIHEEPEKLLSKSPALENALNDSFGHVSSSAVLQAPVKPKSAGTFECGICGKKYKHTQSLKRHLVSHENRPKRFKCQRCEHSTDFSYKFKIHQNFHERNDRKYARMENPLKCKVCPAYCTNKQAMNNHMLKVHPKKLYECDLCGKYSKTKTRLQEHLLQLHLKVKSYRKHKKSN